MSETCDVPIQSSNSLCSQVPEVLCLGVERLAFDEIIDEYVGVYDETGSCEQSSTHRRLLGTNPFAASLLRFISASLMCEN